MTNRTEALFAVRIRNEDSTVQLAAWVEDQTTKIWLRTQPDATTTKPRWMDAVLPPTLWPGKSPSALRGATGTIQGYLTRKLSSSTPVTIDGVWLVTLTDEDTKTLDALNDNPSEADTNSIKTRIARVFDGTTPRSVSFDSISDASEWLTGPIQSLVEGKMESYTESVLKGPSEVPVLSATEVEGIALTDGKTTFVPRNWWGGLTDVTFLRRARETDVYVLLAGPPGTGKSALVEAAFIDEYRDMGLVFKNDALIVGTEDTAVQDIVGGSRQNKKTGIFEFEPGNAIKCAIGDGKRGVPLFMDEALLVDPRVLSVLYPLIDGRGVLPLPTEYGFVDPYTGVENAVHARPGFYIVFAGNPDVPGAVISEALASRCVLKPEYLTDYDTAAKLMGPAHAEVVTVARNMETKRQEGEVMWAPQMRDLLGYRDVAHAFGTEVALSNLLANCVSDSDREVLSDVIARTLGVSNIRPFRV